MCTLKRESVCVRVTERKIVKSVYVSVYMRENRKIEKSVYGV